MRDKHTHMSVETHMSKCLILIIFGIIDGGKTVGRVALTEGDDQKV